MVIGLASVAFDRTQGFAAGELGRWRARPEIQRRSAHRERLGSFSLAVLLASSHEGAFGARGEAHGEQASIGKRRARRCSCRQERARPPD